MNNEMTICIAGKNNIAVTVAEYILKEYKEVTLIACCNATDNGKNGFQRSFKSFCTQHQVPVKKLEELYSISNLIFLSLEYDRIIRPSNFLTEKLKKKNYDEIQERESRFNAIKKENFSSFSFLIFKK